MLKVTGIEKGIVMDHITAGNGLKIFDQLNLDKLEVPVVLLMNVHSNKFGRKDIIKIQGIIDIDLTIIALIDRRTTINIIKNDQISLKKRAEIPKKVHGLFKCKNPRCITSVDNYAVPQFTLVPNGKMQYRCNYCEELTEYRL